MVQNNTVLQDEFFCTQSNFHYLISKIYITSRFSTLLDRTPGYFLFCLNHQIQGFSRITNFLTPAYNNKIKPPQTGRSAVPFSLGVLLESVGNGDGSVAQMLAVHRLHGRVRSVERGEVDESEPLAVARVRISHDLCK